MLNNRLLIESVESETGGLSFARTRRATRESPISQASRTVRVNQSSFGTTRVSLSWTAPDAWSTPGRARAVPEHAWSR